MKCLTLDYRRLMRGKKQCKAKQNDLTGLVLAVDGERQQW